MAINRNENKFGTLLTALSILVIGVLIAFVVHKTVPVTSYNEDETECGHGCCAEEANGCHHMDDEYYEENEYEEDVD